MKLTVFGNNATCPEAGGACSSFLLEADDKKILLDLGCGSLAKAREKIDLTTLDAIIISHLHFDHFGDLFCAKYHLETRKAYGEKIVPIMLLAPQLPEWAKKELDTNGVFDIHVLKDGSTFFIDAIKVDFARVVHSVEGYGVRVNFAGKVLAYSGDSAICDSLNFLAASADAFLCEATFFGNNSVEAKQHLSAQNAAKLSIQAGCKQLLLTHYHSEQKEEIYKEAAKYFEKVVLTKIGETYYF
jgi:ribonuclease BN (tRNA processing enzyme)